MVLGTQNGLKSTPRFLSRLRTSAWVDAAEACNVDTTAAPRSAQSGELAASARSDRCSNVTQKVAVPESASCARTSSATGALDAAPGLPGSSAPDGVIPPARSANAAKTTLIRNEGRARPDT